MDDFKRARCLQLVSSVRYWSVEVKLVADEDIEGVQFVTFVPHFLVLNCFHHTQIG